MLSRQEADSFRARRRERARGLLVIQQSGKCLVRSSNGDKWYQVDPIKQTCTCEDWKRHNDGPERVWCKHLYAVEGPATGPVFIEGSNETTDRYDQRRNP